MYVYLSFEKNASTELNKGSLDYLPGSYTINQNMARLRNGISFYNTLVEYLVSKFSIHADKL